MYFPEEKYHILGDAAFAIRSWLMTPFRQTRNLARRERRHNQILSSCRVVIENIFGITKGRFRRLQYINTYSVSKAIEITTAACVLHNFCYLSNDEFTGEPYEEEHLERREGFYDNDVDAIAGRTKRDEIADTFI